MASKGRDKEVRKLGSEPFPQRIAAPGRELVSLTPRSGMAASVLGTAAALGTLGFGPAAAAAVATATAGVFGARIGGRTLGQWITLRREHRKALEQSALFSNDSVGVIFDGLTATALVEITPRAWQVTTVGPTGANESPVISADVLRRQLHQYDIELSGIDVICAGYKFAARDNASAALDTLIGPVSVPLGGVTVIAVSLDLSADVLGAAYRRSRRGSLPVGLCQALTIAATRVSYALAEQGFGGRLMSATQVRDFHDGVLAQVARPLAAPGWRNCGPRTGVHTRTYVPSRGHWNADSAGAWNHLQSHRQYTTLSLTSTGSGAALAQPLVTYLVRGSDGFDKASGYGLHAALGQQVAALSRTLAISRRRPLRSPGAVIDDHHHLGFGIPAGGAGMFIGSRADKTRVFVAVPAAPEPLWLAGPKLFAMQMVGRLSTQDRRITVVVDDPAWQAVVDHRGTPALTAGTEHLAMADVVVATPQWWERHRERCEDKAVMLVTEEDPGHGAVNSLVVRGGGGEGRSVIAVKVDGQLTEVSWELTPIERRALIGESVNESGSPRSGSRLDLAPVVELPVSDDNGRRKQRQAAPAPEVSTVGQAAAPGEAAPPVGRPRKPRSKPMQRPVGDTSLDTPKQDVVAFPGAQSQPRKAPPRKVPVRKVPPREAEPSNIPVHGTVVQPPNPVEPKAPSPPRGGRHYRREK